MPMVPALAAARQHEALRERAEAWAKEELISATLSFDRLHRWQSVFPMRDWRAGRQAHASRLIAEEFTLLADAADRAASDRSNGV
jgi:hypothetical protein